MPIQIDMEMPKNCRTCRFCQDDDYSPFPYFHVDNEVLAWRELPEPWEGVSEQCENG